MKLESEKGSILIFVLVMVLFMSSFLIVLYASNINKSKAVKEQFDIISNIYSKNGNNEISYDKAYAKIRNKNKQILKEKVENNILIELTKTFEGNVDNYIIYGNTNGLGNLIEDTTDKDYGKYKISIKVTSNDEKNETKDIILDNPLYESEYIEYETGRFVKKDGTVEIIDLPDLITYEDYTKIEVLTNMTPSKIEVEYEGYTINN